MIVNQCLVCGEIVVEQCIGFFKVEYNGKVRMIDDWYMFCGVC